VKRVITAKLVVLNVVYDMIVMAHAGILSLDKLAHFELFAVILPLPTPIILSGVRLPPPVIAGVTTN
jgi:hypothetical protein